MVRTNCRCQLPWKSNNADLSFWLFCLLKWIGFSHSNSGFSFFVNNGFQERHKGIFSFCISIVPKQCFVYRQRIAFSRASLFKVHVYAEVSICIIPRLEKGAIFNFNCKLAYPSCGIFGLLRVCGFNQMFQKHANLSRNNIYQKLFYLGISEHQNQYEVDKQVL